MKKKVIAVLAAGVLSVTATGETIVNAATARGDVNQDGKIDLSDCAEVLSYYAEYAAGLDPVFRTNATQNAVVFKAADVDENNTVNLQDATFILTYYAQTAANIDTDWTSIIPGLDVGNDTPVITPDGTLGEGGNELTILSWYEDDLQYMYDIVSEASGMDKYKIVYKNVGYSGTEAHEQYYRYFLSGEDIDLYCCDTDWIMEYQNNDYLSAPLSAVGITEDMYANAFPYTISLGKDENGVLKGATWQVAAGGYVYRTDLAEKYLGITNPEDMQAAVSDWDKFWATAAKVYTKSYGVTAMADSLGGVCRAYAYGNRKAAWVQDKEITVENAEYCFGDIISTIKKKYDAGYISNINQWTDGWLDQGKSEGTYADGTFGFFFPTWSLGAGSQLSQAEGEEGDYGSTYGLYNIIPGPTGWYWGGTYFCVSPQTDNALEAGQFIYYMTANEETMEKYHCTKGEFVNNMAVMKRYKNYSPLLGGQDCFDSLYQSASKVDESFATEYDARIYTELQWTLQDYCEGYIDSDWDCMNEFLYRVSVDLEDVIVG